MAAIQDSPQKPEQRRTGEAGLIEAVVGDNVLSTLGRPAGLLRVQVAPVGAGRFRVNVFVGDGGTSTKVAHSYFVEADSDGKILSSSPLIQRMY